MRVAAVTCQSNQHIERGGRTAGLSESWVNSERNLHLLVESSIKKSLVQVTVYGGFPFQRFAVTLICARSHAPSSQEPPLLSLRTVHK